MQSMLVLAAVLSLFSVSLGKELHAVKASIPELKEHLERAAIDTPQRNKQDTIQRDVHDILFLLEQSLKARERADVAARKEYAQEALALLHRSAGLGYFDLGKAESVVIFIRQLLSD